MRRYLDALGHLVLGEGDYGQDSCGVWHVRPKGHHIGSIPDHKVTIHEDETITVVPSIVIEGVGDEKEWHGRLIKGEFTECGGKKT